MSKIIFLGADLHSEPTELAAKIVNNLKCLIKDYKIVSIQNRKEFIFQNKTLIVPKLIIFNMFRKSLQAILLPIYFIILRLFGYNIISSFWVANSVYHKYLFKFLKFIRYKLIFTVISDEDLNLDVLKQCNYVVVQSQYMFEILNKQINNLKLIYPSVNLNIFKPSRKYFPLLIPSIPYSVKDFSQRGIDLLFDFLNKYKYPTKVIFRSNESYKFVKNLKLLNVKLINKNLDDFQLSKIMTNINIIPLFYFKSPDMPLSAIEGLASGCAIICRGNTGLSKIIKENNAGIIIKDISELKPSIDKILNNKKYNQNARIVAEKYFSLSNLNDYLKIFNSF